MREEDDPQPNPTPTHAFFVSVAAKGVSHAVSLCLQQLRESISLQLKDLRSELRREGNFVRSSDLRGLKDYLSAQTGLRRQIQKPL